MRLSRLLLCAVALTAAPALLRADGKPAGKPRVLLVTHSGGFIHGSVVEAEHVQVAALRGQERAARLDAGHQVGLDRCRAGVLEKPASDSQSPADQGLETRLVELVGAPHPPILAAACR